MVTSRIDELGRVLLGKTRGIILSHLYNSPDEPLHVRRIARLTGLGLGPTQRELQLLARLGILKRQEIGRQVLYSPDVSSPVHEELRSLIQKTFGIVGVLRQALLPLAGDTRVAFLFGSFAQARQKAASDIDIMIIGDASFQAVVRTLLEPQRQLKREINPAVYRTAEFAAKLHDGHPFVSTVMASPKTFLLGDENEVIKSGRRTAGCDRIRPLLRKSPACAPSSSVTSRPVPIRIWTAIGASPLLTTLHSSLPRWP